MQLPEEILVGSQMLDDESESLSLGLLELSNYWAHNVIEEGGYKKVLGVKKNLFGFRNKEEENRLFLEFTMFNLFIISRWLSSNYDNHPEEVLDRMFFHFRKAASENDLEFGEMTVERYVHYHKVFDGDKEGDPILRLGEAVACNCLNKIKVEPMVAMQASLFFGKLMILVAESVKELIASEKYKKKLRRRQKQ